MSREWLEQRVAHWFATGWAEQFAKALKAVDGVGLSTPPLLEPADPHPDAWGEWQNPAWFSVKADAVSGAELFIGCARDTAKALVPGVEAGDAPSVEPAIEEYRRRIDQALSALSPAITRNSGKTVELGPAKQSAAPATGELGVEYQVNLGGVVHLLALVPSTDLIDTVLDAVPEVVAEAAPPGESGAPSNSAAEGSDEGRLDGSSGPDRPTSGNLDVLLDVDLDLSVSFGQAELLLEDVLTLASGSIVELNRSANDPVDVLVNNSIVARGEVVVVDGNYGIRVTEVVSRKERIRSVM